MKFPEIDSPFATFEGGSGYVLPNDLPYMAHDALQRLKGEPASDVLPSLLKSGRMSLVHGMQAKDAHNVWNFFIWYYLTRNRRQNAFHRRPNQTARPHAELFAGRCADPTSDPTYSRISTIFLAGFAPLERNGRAGTNLARRGRKLLSEIR